jgi:hypothetical protein
MPSRKSPKPEQGQPRRRKPAPTSLDWENTADYVSLDVASALRVLASEQQSHRLLEIFTELKRQTQADPGLAMRVPASLLGLFASCTATTGTSAVAVSPCDVVAMAGRIVIAFNWTDTSAAGSGCKVTDFDSLTLTDTTTSTTIGWNAIQELQRTAATPTGPPAWFGKTHAGTPAATFAAGSAVTVNLTFKTTALLWCHTCTPSPLVVSISTTIK